MLNGWWLYPKAARSPLCGLKISAARVSPQVTTRDPSYRKAPTELRSNILGQINREGRHQWIGDSSSVDDLGRGVQYPDVWEGARTSAAREMEVTSSFIAHAGLSIWVDL